MLEISNFEKKILGNISNSQIIREIARIKLIVMMATSSKLYESN